MDCCFVVDEDDEEPPKSPKASTDLFEDDESAKGSNVDTWLGLEWVSFGVDDDEAEEEATGVDVTFFSGAFGVSVFLDERDSDGGSNLVGLFWKSLNGTPSIVNV